MDIVFVGTLEPFPGGTGVINSLVVRGLAARGHRIRAVAPVVRDETESLDDARDFPGVDIARYLLPESVIEPRKMTDALVAAEMNGITGGLRSLGGDPPHVVFVGRESFMRYVPDALPWPVDVPIVLTAHSITANGTLDRDVPQSDASREMRNRLATCRTIVLVGKSQRPNFASLGVPLVDIPNGVDLDKFAPGDEGGGTRSATHQEAVTVVHVSNLKEAKRPLDLVEAARIVVEKGADVRFRVCGDGPLRGEMEAAVRRAGLGSHFAFAGWVDRNGLPAEYRAADVAVLMSAREVMPCAALEAAASGCVLVGSAIPWTDELIEEGQTGFTYPVGDTAALAAILLRLAGDPDLRTRVGEAARRSVVSRDSRVAITRYEQVLLAAATPRPTAGGHQMVAIP